MEARFRYVLENPTTNSTLIDMLMALPANFSDFFQSHLSSRALFDHKNVFAIIYWGALSAGLCLLLLKRYQAFLLVMFFLGIAICLPTLFQFRGYLYHYAIYVEPWAIFAFCISIWALSVHIQKPRVLVITAIILSLFVGGFQTRYRNLAPSAANTRPLHSTCNLKLRTPYIYERIDRYCEKHTATGLPE